MTKNSNQNYPKPSNNSVGNSHQRSSNNSTKNTQPTVTNTIPSPKPPKKD